MMRSSRASPLTSCLSRCARCGQIGLFNSAILHTATTRPTDSTRKSVQIYYGHLDKPYLANDSVIPPIFWRDHPDPETRRFYGNLNERTRTFMRAFPAPPRL